ncbi:MAG TPA: penicillin-binding transpeptidase domain-containing protein [Clostridiales bacterium]|nr:penicillin-binding transpeptidase domain-containing protein [Clostridiales bacterium]
MRKDFIQLTHRRFWRKAAALGLIGLLTLLPAACAAKPGSSGASGTTGASSDTSATTTVETLNQDDPRDTLVLYGQAWTDQDFAAMYQFLSAAAKTYISEAAFIERYTNITGGIEAADIRVSCDATEVFLSDDGKATTLPFTASMNTLAGPVTITGYQMNLLLESQGDQAAWTVDWTENLIFPNLEATDKVRARILYPRRGEIRDRNGAGLAVNGDLITIGVVPGKFNAVKEEAIPQMAELLGISAERIKKALVNATHSDWFYPVVTLPANARDLSAQLTAIDGVQYQNTTGRIYPSAASAALMIGYIGNITAEELARHPDEGYTATDKIGKMGLEQVYEQRLRGQRGGEVYLTAADDRFKEQIALRTAVDGENITLAIDSRVQASLYTQMMQDAGAAAAINPRTGEILALVSTPSFDPNLLQTYVPDTVQTSWNEAVKSPFANRFKVAYAPGSVFKLVTAAIGLRAGTLDPDEALTITGLTWQPDSSWGGYKITRVKDSGQPVNMLRAFLYSDNIYFAQQALRAGADSFAQGAAGFGIGEDLPIDYPFYTSQIANDDLENEVLLADTGYGQGEVLVSPLHIALFYSTLATNGDLMAPILELKGALQPQVWKAQAVDAEDVPLLADALLQVIENPAGTGYSRIAAQTRMLGKTGTAELKTSLTDDQAEENGWFVAMNVDRPRLTIAMMIEDVKDRHGSHYVVPLVKAAMDDIMPLLPESD